MITIKRHSFDQTKFERLIEGTDRKIRKQKRILMLSPVEEGRSLDSAANEQRD